MAPPAARPRLPDRCPDRPRVAPRRRASHSHQQLAATLIDAAGRRQHHGSVRSKRGRIPRGDLRARRADDVDTTHRRRRRRQAPAAHRTHRDRDRRRWSRRARTAASTPTAPGTGRCRPVMPSESSTVIRAAVPLRRWQRDVERSDRRSPSSRRRQPVHRQLRDAADVARHRARRCGPSPRSDRRSGGPR